MLRFLQRINYFIVYLFSNNLNEFKLYKTLNKSKNIIVVDIGSNQGFFLKKINKIFKNKFNKFQYFSFNYSDLTNEAIILKIGDPLTPKTECNNAVLNTKA